MGITKEEKRNNKPIKVLMIVPNLRVSNGVANFAMNYYRGMDHERIHIDFVTLSYRESPYITEVESDGAKVYVLPSVIKHPRQHLEMCKSIIYNNNYDIIHDNSLNQTIPIMLIAKAKVDKRILHSHSTGMGETRMKEIINSLLFPCLRQLVNNYAACSTNAGKALFKDKPFTVIPNIIEPAIFKFNKSIREKVREREKVQKKVVIGSVGRIAEPKNPFFAIDVISDVLKEVPNVEYWWIGSGPLDKEVERYVSHNNLTSNIRLFGSREDMNELYQAMDVFFLPSRFEGFGLACIEAQASGLPCVISTVFPREVDITNNVKFVALDESKAKWVDAIIHYLNEPPNRLIAYEKCCNSVFSCGNSSQTLMNYYEH